MIEEPQVLVPFHRGEVLSIAGAADIAGRSVRTLREWCQLHYIGRRIGGQWAVSKVALAMHLDGNRDALNGYLSGDRSSPAIVAYFERCGMPLPRQGNSFREQRLSEVKTHVESGVA
jgi:hypothetical protein